MYVLGSLLHLNGDVISLISLECASWGAPCEGRTGPTPIIGENGGVRTGTTTWAFQVSFADYDGWRVNWKRLASTDQT